MRVSYPKMVYNYKLDRGLINVAKFQHPPNPHKNLPLVQGNSPAMTFKSQLVLVGSP